MLTTKIFGATSIAVVLGAVTCFSGVSNAKAADIDAKGDG